jgi:hypothetical protein
MDKPRVGFNKVIIYNDQVSLNSPVVISRKIEINMLLDKMMRKDFTELPIPIWYLPNCLIEFIFNNSSREEIIRERNIFLYALQIKHINFDENLKMITRIWGVDLLAQLLSRYRMSFPNKFKYKSIIMKKHRCDICGVYTKRAWVNKKKKYLIKICEQHDIKHYFYKSWANKKINERVLPEFNKINFVIKVMKQIDDDNIEA